MSIAVMLIALVPLFAMRSDDAVAVALFSIPTAMVAALFAFADRRLPLIGAALSSVGYLTWVGSVAELTGTTEGALAYLFVSLHGVPVAVLGGCAVWFVDVLIRDAFERAGQPSHAPYR
jgi:hypothetical protein